MERPLNAGDPLAKDRAVREVGMGPRRCGWVRLRASMLPLVTRVSISSARSSVDSFSSWIILEAQTSISLGIGLGSSPSGHQEAGASGLAQHFPLQLRKILLSCELNFVTKLPFNRSSCGNGGSLVRGIQAIWTSESSA